jgi:bifunctional UDP-N-acetylglucosamine pyrophosphorylase/glucosamine-1-phosphate N-acetyltransferase
MSGKRTACIVLAAGLGTRMKSRTAKVLHTIYDRPMLDYVLDTAAALQCSKTVVVVNRDFDTNTSSRKGVSFAVQKEQKGTANALLSGAGALKGLKGTVLVLNGDVPLVTPATLKRFLGRHSRNKNALSVLSFNAYDPASYGRILRGDDGEPLGIVEEKDASGEQKLICEVNSGVYAFTPSALDLVKSIRLNRKKKEYYLTDIVSLCLKKGLSAGVYCVGDEEEFLGINSRLDLARVHEVLRIRKVRELLAKGVTLMDPASTHVAPQVRIGADSVIYPNTYIHGGTRIGRGCTIYPNTRIFESTINDGAVVKDSCLIEESTIGKRAQVGPMAHLRPGSVLSADVKVGNFVEIKKSTIGTGTKAMHLSYIGDANVGKGANIGAGTITCNYDGRKKHITVIGDGVFIGSDTQLVAPVRIEKGSYVGAGSTITKDVPKDSLSFSRPRQKTVEGWSKKKRK